jgi:gliding motility-associated-like protein
MIEFLHLQNDVCEAFQLPTAEIEIHDLPSIEYSLSADSICSGDMVELSIDGINNEGLLSLQLNYDGSSQEIFIDDATWSSSFFPDSDLSVELGPLTDQTTGCVDSTAIQLESVVIQYPAVILQDDFKLCSGDTVLVGTPSEVGVIYQWTPSSIIETPDDSFTFISIVNNGTEAISQQITLIAESFNCVTSDNVILTVDPLPEVAFGYNPQPVTAVNPIINLYNLTQGSNSYIWTLDGDTISDELNISWLLQEDAVEEYEICLEAISSIAGCQNSHCEGLEVVGEMSVYIPNSFSPDGDGLNDEFGPVIRNADLRFYSLDIFDRGGSKVFSSNSVSEWWNGKEKNVGKRARVGVYNYILTTRDKFSRNPQLIRGMVTLIR